MKTEIKKLISDITGLIAQKEGAPVAEKASLDSQISEMKSTLENMEKQMYRVPAGNGHDAGSNDVKSFDTFLRTMDHKYLRTDSDPDGGYLLPREMYNQIIHKIVETSDMRRLCKVVTIGGKSLDVNTAESDMTVYPVGEGGTVTESEPAYGRINIVAHKLMAKAIITNELLQDGAFDMISELNDRAAQKFAQFEGSAYINGNGLDRAQGILTATGVGNVNSGDANLILPDAFFSMLGNFKYRNPTFIMNRSTYAAVRKLKTTINSYLIDDGLDGNPNMQLGGIAGYIANVPVVLMQDMPNVGAGLVPVVLADFQSAYMIVDRVGMSIRRDDLTLMDQDQVKFVMSRRTGGAVVNPDAVVTMTIST